jgi:hypothetical protein
MDLHLKRIHLRFSCSSKQFTVSATNRNFRRDIAHDIYTNLLFIEIEFINSTEIANTPFNLVFEILELELVSVMYPNHASISWSNSYQF